MQAKVGTINERQGPKFREEIVAEKQVGESVRLAGWLSSLSGTSGSLCRFSHGSQAGLSWMEAISSCCFPRPAGSSNVGPPG